MAKKIEDIARNSANKEYPPEYEMSDDNWKQRAGYVKGFKAGVEWQKSLVWHKPSEEPKRDKEVLVEYKSGFHDAGYYAENEKIFYTGNELVKKDDITRWAYIEDLTQL